MADKTFPVWSAIAGKCPRCSRGRLFDGYLKLAPRCNVCGLDYSFVDSGDGPAVFVTLLAGLVVVALALWVEVVYEPPLWVYAVIFIPLTILLCLSLLRPLKGFMVAAQYHHRAEEGRLEQ